MKILLGAIGLVAVTLCTLLIVDGRMRSIVDTAPESTSSWTHCIAGQFLTGEGKCKTAPEPEIDLSLPLPDNLPKCAPGELYDGDYKCRSPIIGATSPPACAPGKQGIWCVETINPHAPAPPLTFTTASPSILTFGPDPCTTGHDVGLNISNGKEIVVFISQCTGKVTLTHPENADAAAREFWRAIQATWPQACKVKKQ